MRKPRLMWAGILPLVLFSVTPAFGNVIRVPSEVPTIRQALAMAMAGDSVRVDGGIYYEPGPRAIVRPGVSLIGSGDWRRPGADPTILYAFGLECPDGTLPVLLENLWLYSKRVLTFNPSTHIRNCRFGPEVYTEFQDEFMVQFLAGGSLEDCFLYGGPPMTLTSAIDATGGDIIIRGNVFYPYTELTILAGDWYVPLESLSIRNNTIWSGATVFLDPADIEFVNNITTSGGMLECRAGPGPFIAHNCFAWYLGSPGCAYADSNIMGDPEFCENPPAAYYDYRLRDTSPCIGTGENGTTMGALWVGCGATSIPTYDRPSLPSRLTVNPNPVHSGAEFSFEPRSDDAILEVYDPEGRLIDLLRPGTLPTMRWSPSRHARSGVYFARLRGRGVSQVVKFLVVR